MSRGRKLTKAEKRLRRRRRDSAEYADVTDRDVPTDDEIVDDFTTGTLCASGTAADHASLCQLRLDVLDADLRRLHIASAAWKDCPGPAAPLGHALADLVAACERHRLALAELRDRLGVLADDESVHEHLDPSAIDVDAVRRALFP